MDIGRMKILTREGIRFVDVTPKEASVVGSYFNALKDFLQTGDDSDLAVFEGDVIAGIPLETDPEWIEYWAYRGDLDFEDIYEG